MRSQPFDTRRRSLIAAAALAAAATVALGVTGWRYRHRGTPGTAAGEGLAARLFPAGVEQTYRLEYATRVETTAGQPMTSFTLDGELRLVGLAGSPSVIVRAAFTGDVATQAGGGAGAAGAGGDPAALAEAIRRPFILELAPDGSFRGARGEPGTPAFVGRLWSALGEYLQVTRGGAKGTSWEVEEHDAAGRYRARYEEQSPREMTKRKLAYVSLRAGTSATYQVIASSGEIGLDPRGALASFELSEDLKVSFGGGPLPGFEARTSVELRRTNVGSASTAIAGWLGESARAVALNQSPREENQRVRDRALIGGLTLADALSGVKSFEDRGATHEQRLQAGRAYVALAAMLRQDPGAAMPVLRANLRAGGSRALTDALLGALRDAGTPEAQKLLAEMSAAGSPLDGEQRMEAARSLSRVAAPTAETVDALKSLRADPEVAAQATLGLGSALHRLQDQDPALAGEVRSALVDQLSAAATPGEQAAVLTALGNAGDAATLDNIRAYVASDAPEVRGAAAQALRRIAGADADQMLAGLCGDRAATVRLSAVDAIGERSFSPALGTALSSLASGEPEYQVRAKAVNVLAGWSPTAPAVADTLTVVASRDPNADLRNVASRALANK